MKGRNSFPEKIESRDNPKLKLARSVRDGRERSLIFVEGLRLAEDLEKAGLTIETVFFTEKFAANARGEALLSTLAAKSLQLVETTETAFDSLSDTKESQGIVIIARRPEAAQTTLKTSIAGVISPLLVLLHRLSNPANIGAILRTAEAAGVAGVIATKNTADIYSAKSLRGSMGAAFRLPSWTNADFFDVLQWAGENEIAPISADISGGKSYLDIDWIKPRLLVLGSEGHGLSAPELAAAGETMIIPMSGGVESLNVAVACGIVLFEAKRQRKESRQ